MKEEPISYPFLTGAYEGMLSFLALSLMSKGFIKDSKYEDVREYIASEVARVKKSERTSSNPAQVA